MTKDGDLTGKIGKKLAGNNELDDYLVYYDHGESNDEKVGNIYITIDKEVNRKTQIGQLDIAIVRKEDSHAVLLVEIEESSANPKTIIGDIFTFLLGNYVIFKKKNKDFKVTNETTFLVLINGNEKPERIKNIINQKAMLAKKAIRNDNALVGKIEIEWYSSESELINIIRSIVK